MVSVDPSRVHDVGFHVAWHGRFMTLAWGFLVPLGVVIARYYKVTRKQNWPTEVDNHFWWRCHLTLQISAALLTLIALGLMWNYREFKWFGSTHFVLGWLIAILAIGQVAGGVLRGSKGGPTDPAPDGSLHGDHYDMTVRRLAFEIIHKTAGYIALLLAFVAVLTGIWEANGPRWMWISLIAWWCSLLLFSLRQERTRRCPDTYQALWGPDPIHPGNKKKKRSRARH